MKIGIIGSGFVGATAAYAVALSGGAREIVLVDINAALAAAQAEDILHATPFGPPARVTAGTYADLAGAGFVVLACGVGQRPDETRLQLLERNVRVFSDVTPQVVRHAPDAVLLIASNPVDLMTQVVTRISGVPRSRVIGTGTILDTARFRSLLGDHLGISPHSVHGYLLGEHGDSEVVIWSSAQVGGIPLHDFAGQVNRPMTDDKQARIDDAVRNSAYRIIKGKGATYYGIAAGIDRIVRAVRDNECAVLTVSALAETEGEWKGACLSLPRVVGSEGIIETLRPALSEEEARSLSRSADMLRTTAQQIGYS
jgi:L-lactate dehydrogenase